VNQDLPDFVFVCTGPNCGERGGRELLKAWKAILLGQDRWDICRVVPANCFGQCATGPNACHLSSGRFQSGVDPARAGDALLELTGLSAQTD
jgi:NADH:ubiquinone oxidoreductase subunit E